MDWDPMDDETLGRAVDAWLTALRIHGMPGERLAQVAGTLGDAMASDGPTTLEQITVLRAFTLWWTSR